jgi:GT2 family glycosyltransferase
MVVDDGSSKDCTPSIHPFRDTLNIRLFRQSRQGPAAARNRGAKEATGHYLAFLDDDCTLPGDWLTVVTHSVSHQLVLGGKTVNKLTGNLYSTASQLLVDFLYAYYNAEESNAPFLTSNNLILPAGIFRDIGGFDTAFTDAAAEDRDLCDRLVFSGVRIQYTPSINVYHWHAMTLTTFVRQHYGYGRGARTYHRIRAQRRQTSLRIEPWRFYARLIAYPFQKASNNSALFILLLFVLSQTANALGFFLACSRLQNH